MEVGQGQNGGCNAKGKKCVLIVLQNFVNSVLFCMFIDMGHLFISFI
jgi:hypothetical protein